MDDKDNTPKDKRRYRIGIDVGRNSTGFCALEIDDDDNPISFLSLSVLLHDAGVGKDGGKTQETRKAISGRTRRARRLIRNRRRRLAELDQFLADLGWPLPDLENYPDPHEPWKVRALLVEEYIEDEQLRHEKLAIAIRHIARHRGWRSPWVSVSSLHVSHPESDEVIALRSRVAEKTGRILPEDLTPGQLLYLLDRGEKIRGDAGILAGKLLQSDYATELKKIFSRQKISEDLGEQLIDRVFASKSPKGSAAEKVGKDALPGQEHLDRAEKAHPAFQHYRIATIIANLRIREGEGGQKERRLTGEEMSSLFKFLSDPDRKKVPTWIEVAKVLGIERQDLLGTGKLTADGERTGNTPPVDETNIRLTKCSIKPVQQWWRAASYLERCAFIEQISRASAPGEAASREEQIAADFVASLNDEDLEKLESSVRLPIGRAAYSVESLGRITERILTDNVDLQQAREIEFGVSPEWKPPAVPVGEPVGNPVVDRVMKGVNRWLLRAEAEWGIPQQVNIEHVREAFMSKAKVNELQRFQAHRFKKNEEARLQIEGSQNLSGLPRIAAIRKQQALQRQHCECLYCGTHITFATAEMDHIVPRRGVGSTNTRDNLVAVCRRCNQEKSNIPFAVWAAQTNIPGVSQKEAISRVKGWFTDTSVKDDKSLRAGVIDRLSRTKADPEIDNRSMEAVSWMARELAHRIEQRYRTPQGQSAAAIYTSGGEAADSENKVKVRVFNGSITAAARRASGFEGRVNLIGGRGKTRLDRRHHAMDAATIAMMRPAVAQTLVERENLRRGQIMAGGEQNWKSWKGSTFAQQKIYAVWLEQMLYLTEIYNQALADDQIPVFSNFRLRLGDGKLHERVYKLHRKRLGDAWSMEDIDRAETPALWCALTRLPDFVWAEGLPVNPERNIVVNGNHFAADDSVGIFRTSAPMLKVRNGCVEVGTSIHHARIYRITGRKKPVYAMLRVFTVDLPNKAGVDLFQVGLPEQSISVRNAEMKLREAFREGNAEYLGWLVVDDELELDLSAERKGAIAELLSEYPGISHWSVDGFPMNSKLRLRPLYLAGEGVPEDALPGTKEILQGKGWRAAVNKLLSTCKPRVIRRDVLGNIRKDSSRLPSSWSI